MEEGQKGKAEGNFDEINEIRRKYTEGGGGRFRIED
jgi:hypothetical protein